MIGKRPLPPQLLRHDGDVDGAHGALRAPVHRLLSSNESSERNSCEE